MMTENEQAAYPCPDIDCDGVVEYETTGYWQCSDNIRSVFLLAFCPFSPLFLLVG